jgi:hypothetical protein
MTDPATNAKTSKLSSKTKHHDTNMIRSDKETPSESKKSTHKIARKKKVPTSSIVDTPSANTTAASIHTTKAVMHSDTTRLSKSAMLTNPYTGFKAKSGKNDTNVSSSATNRSGIKPPPTTTDVTTDINNTTVADPYNIDKFFDTFLPAARGEESDDEDFTDYFQKRKSTEPDDNVNKKLFESPESPESKANESDEYTPLDKLPNSNEFESDKSVDSNNSRTNHPPTSPTAKAVDDFSIDGTITLSKINNKTIMRRIILTRTRTRLWKSNTYSSMTVTPRIMTYSMS